MKFLMLESENIFVNFQWPSKLGFPRKIRVYVVPVAWFAQLKSFFFVLSNHKMAKKKVKEKHQCVYPTLPSPIAVKSVV